jgi:uncharacterized protein (TIGR00266 family)
MKVHIEGKLAPMAQIDLESGERIYAQAGSLMFKTGSVDMEPTGRGEGASGIFKRLITAETILFLEFKGPGTVGLSPFFPGEIKEVVLAENESIHVNRGAFLFAERSVQYDVDWVSRGWWQRAKMGLLGGEGFFFQKLTGPGRAYLYVCGDIVETELAAGQTVQVEQGALVYKDVEVGYELERVKGLGRIMFSGAGLFLVTLTGPGKVALQTMDLNRFVGRIVAPIIRS